MTFHELQPNEWRKIGYLSAAPTVDLVPVLPWYDGKWHSLLATQDGLIDMNGIVLKGDYLAKTPVHPNDIHLLLCDMFYKRAYDRRISWFISAATQDVHNLGAALRAIELYAATTGAAADEVSQLCVVPLEFLVGLSRSFFDLLQHIILHMAKTRSRTKIQNLPPSFADIALHGDNPRPSMDIERKWKVSAKLAEYYAESAPFFLEVRRLRNSFEHDGKTPGPILHDPGHFYVLADDPLFSNLIGLASPRRLRNMVSLIDIANFIARETLRSMDAFASVAIDQFDLPEDIAPDYHVYLRGYHSGLLSKVI